MVVYTRVTPRYRVRSEFTFFTWVLPILVLIFTGNPLFALLAIPLGIGLDIIGAYLKFLDWVL